MDKMMYITILREVDLACKPGPNTGLMELLKREKIKYADFVEAKNILGSWEDTKQFLVLMLMGAGRRSALARALDIRPFAEAYVRLAYQGNGTKDVQEAARRRRALVVNLNAALMESKNGRYAVLSRRAKLEFCDDMIDYWIHQVFSR